MRVLALSHGMSDCPLTFEAQALEAARTYILRSYRRCTLQLIEKDMPPFLRAAVQSATAPVFQQATSTRALGISRGLTLSHPALNHATIIPRARLLSARTHRRSPARITPVQAAATAPPLIVYTDGSHHRDGGSGAAARTLTPWGETLVLREFLGAAEEHSSTGAELLGLVLGMQALRLVGEMMMHRARRAGRRSGVERAVILTDCQPVLRILANPAAETAREGEFRPLINRFFEASVLAARVGVQDVQLRWIRGHAGVVGNESVDLDAKAARMGHTGAFLVRGIALGKGNNVR
ncbi:unnamed protein product [Mycena citricolor]|uniref:RNase H type-1 domain-containing protein n=1 Tax=Mycena citricolor TaxID=2018698 RepID=A0AAD2HQT8_9AGAR|nr:unnamed protein product [Mycena citricolor]CAK5280423.1 unnamed protein product [Mycena citricolor]